MVAHAHELSPVDAAFAAEDWEAYPNGGWFRSYHGITLVLRHRVDDWFQLTLLNADTWAGTFMVQVNDQSAEAIVRLLATTYRDGKAVKLPEVELVLASGGF